jgi:phosphoribosylanthranilate isomerase
MGRVRVKICGVTTPADARLAAGAGADAIGVNFFPPSPRYVEPRRAAEILAALPALIDVVGVFAETPVRQVCALAYQLGLGCVQWHGNHGDAPPDAAPFRWIPAFRVRDRASLDAIGRYLGAARAVGRLPAAVLVDGHVEGLHGGTGQTAPWDLLAEFRPDVPLILAGGLTPDNVAEAVRRVRPFAVDVASGVESSPGVKDPEKVRRFIEAADCET